MGILMKLFEVVQVPVAIAKDVFDISNFIDGNKSYTRQKIKDIEDA